VSGVVFDAEVFFDPFKKRTMIQLQHLTIQLTGFTLQDVSLTMEKGEFFILLGPTGAGKTLILETIAGLIPSGKGCIRIGGRDVTRLPPEKRGVGIVYQDQALFPHMSVGKNISYGLRYHKKTVTNGKVSRDFLIRRLGLTHLLDRPVQNLSGGEKQRVALARALAIDPAVLLLDEPLSSLDPNFREDIRQLLKELHRETGITVLMVTHDFSEAHFLAQRVAVMNSGRIEQVGSVDNVFLRPATPFVADFVGMKNIFPATFHDSQARVGKVSFHLTAPKDRQTAIAIRPEHIRIFNTAADCEYPNILEGTILRISNQGVYCDVVVKAWGLQFLSILTTSEVQASRLIPGLRVFIGMDPGNIHMI
jgi:molybdate/tungstate transport system ATP-binding protein